MQPFVSIVVNNFNYGRYLRAAIESALRQERCPIEVIVVDDGSTDDSRAVIASFGDRIAAVLKENGGQASAINAGVARARGEYVLLLDSDDVLHPDAVKTAVANFAPGYARVAWQLRRIDESGRPLPERLQQPLWPGFDGDAIGLYMDSGGFPMTPTSGNLFRATDLHAVLPIAEDRFRICADVPVLVWTAERGRVRVLAQVLADYRIHGGNQFHSGTDFFDPKTIRAHVEAETNSRMLLGEAARRRDAAFVPPPIVGRLSTAVKIVLGRRIGVASAALEGWSLARVISDYWVYGQEPRFRKVVGVLMLAASAWMPLSLLKIMRKSSRRRP